MGLVTDRPKNKTDVIIEMTKKGAHPSLIARELGIKPSTVRARIWTLRKKNRIPNVKTVDVAFVLKGKASVAAVSEARKRKTTVNDFAAQIVSCVLMDGMVDAVLDEEG